MGAATPGTALKEVLRRLHLLLLMMMMMRRRLFGGEEGPPLMKRRQHAGQDPMWQRLARRRTATPGQARTAPRCGEFFSERVSSMTRLMQLSNACRFDSGGRGSGSRDVGGGDGKSGGEGLGG